MIRSVVEIVLNNMLIPSDILNRGECTVGISNSIRKIDPIFMESKTFFLLFNTNPSFS